MDAGERQFRQAQANGRLRGPEAIGGARLSGLLGRIARRSRIHDAAERGWESIADPAWAGQVRFDGVEGGEAVILVLDPVLRFDLDRRREHYAALLRSRAPGVGRIRFVFTAQAEHLDGSGNSE